MSTPAVPAVSVVICMHNGARYIVETLASVRAQTMSDFEVVVIDDGSTDGGADLVHATWPDSRLRLIRQEQRGLAPARNRALLEAQGELVAFIDQDDLWHPEKLRRHVEAAAASPDAALFFSDCLLVDAQGDVTGKISDRFDLRALRLDAGQAELELLRRGCFIALPAAVARRHALSAAGGFDVRWRHVEDYDMWLRIARRHRLHCIVDPLASYRVHDAQFTQRSPEVALTEHDRLWRPIMATASYPPHVRRAIRDNLFGQYRVTCAALLRQRRWRAAMRVAAGMRHFPAGIRDYLSDTLKSSPMPVRTLHWAARLARLAAWSVRYTLTRAARLARRSFGPEGSTRVWTDGSSLGGAETGYFSLVTELIRGMAESAQVVVHVVTDAAGAAALTERLGPRAARVTFRPLGWRAHHWSSIHRRLLGRAGTARTEALMRFIWRRLPAPRWSAPAGTVEILIWRGRFRWRNSRRIAVIQDLTTRIHPDLHTPGNVVEFDEFLEYATAHATEIATVSESSRRDIIERLRVCAESVWVLPMPVHPAYQAPTIDRTLPASRGITGPYVLSVGIIEPRKNLRRLVTAFEAIKGDPAHDALQLVIAGPEGWDDRFDEFLADPVRSAGIVRTGFVPLDELPSLYHCAKAVVCPSVYEGFGLPVLEAMCCSGVVLTSNVSSLPEVIGPEGLVFDPYDPDDIGRVIRRALAFTDAEAEAYRAYCRHRAEHHLARVRARPFPIR